MTEYTEIERDQICEALARRARSLAAEEKSLKEEREKIESRIADLVPVGWTIMVDGVPVRKSLGNRTFSAELAAGHLSPEELAACKADGIDPKKVRELAEAKGLVEACMVSPPADKAAVKLK